MSESSKVVLPLQGLMTAVLGLWICRIAANDDSIPMDLATEKLENNLRSAEAAGTFDPFAYDSKLLLAMFELLAVYNRDSSGIERFARLIGSEIGRLATIPPRLIGESLLLSQRGFVKSPYVPLLKAGDISVNGVSLLRMERPDLLLVCGRIAAASHFGLKSLKAEPGVHLVLKELLPPLLFQTLRDYDLELGATILRTMRYSGLRMSRAGRLGTLFLMDQQDGQGRFGHLSKEALGLSESGTIVPDELATRLYLPTTVSCLWALAETVYGNFTLMDSFRRYRAQCSVRSFRKTLSG